MTTSRPILTAILALIFGQTAFSQCSLALKDGSKISVAAYTWANPSVYDPNFQKLKEEKKDEQIRAYNQNVASGKLAPANTYPMTYTVKKSAAQSGGDAYVLTTTIAGKDYSSYTFCKGDTVYSYRNLGVVELADGKGGSMGFTLQGAQVLPLKIKVGDQLPSYDDITVLYPASFDQTLKRTVIDQIHVVDYGDFSKCSNTYKLRQVDVKVKQTFNFSAHTIHYMYARVTGEEEVVVGGVKYRAYLIQSELWTKPTMDVSYETADAEILKKQQENKEAIQASLTKMSPYKQSVNSLGYMVSYLKEWFVPEIGGMVKTESYDALGGISGGIALLRIE